MDLAKTETILPLSLVVANQMHLRQERDCPSSVVATKAERTLLVTLKVIDSPQDQEARITQGSSMDLPSSI